MQIFDLIRSQMYEKSFSQGLRPTGIYLGRAQLEEIEVFRNEGIVPRTDDNIPTLWGVRVYEVNVDSHIGFGVDSCQDEVG